ncbi:hypothetical protein EVAR_102302_1 [Eumeta japonica]|uniref:Uncharacterized protein n=1 Tax=Eumeta variegata TaxID=151549 RepID=A0A4C1WGX5_EUMVA|nr:hypothetical protein EVAR_102302_1 [Eumeta japonica]
MKELFGFVQIGTITGSRNCRIENEIANRIENKTKKVKMGPELSTGLESKRNVDSASESKVSTFVDNETSINQFQPQSQLRLIDTNNEGIYSMSMLTELWALTRWASHQQEKIEQDLPGRLLFKYILCFSLK